MSQGIVTMEKAHPKLHILPYPFPPQSPLWHPCLADSTASGGLASHKQQSLNSDLAECWWPACWGPIWKDGSFEHGSHWSWTLAAIATEAFVLPRFWVRWSSWSSVVAEAHFLIVMEEVLLKKMPLEAFYKVSNGRRSERVAVVNILCCGPCQKTSSYLRTFTFYETSVMSKGPTFNHSMCHELAIPSFPVLISMVSSYKDWSWV